MNGVIAATGMGAIAQACWSFVTTGVGDIATQILCEGKTLKKIDKGRAIRNATVSGISSLLGSGLGSITSYGYASTGKALVEQGKDKLLTAYLRRNVGQSYSPLLKQGRNLINIGTKYINTGCGISSVTGSILTWGFAYNYAV